MKTIAITQRITYFYEGRDMYDCIDRNWNDFLFRCGIIPFILPNNIRQVKKILNLTKIDGVILSGGDDLICLGGKDLPREQVEEFLIRLCIKKKIPLLGVCRGMQKIQNFFNVKLLKIYSKVKKFEEVIIGNKKTKINSFHLFGTKQNHKNFRNWVVSSDGVVKAIECRKNKIIGIMWHPERNIPFKKEDVKLFKNFFS